MPEETEVLAQYLVTQEWIEEQQKSFETIPVVTRLWTDATSAEQKGSGVSERHSSGMLDVVPEGSLRFIRGTHRIWPVLGTRLKQEQLEKLQLRSVQILNCRELVFDFEWLFLRVSSFLVLICDVRN